MAGVLKETYDFDKSYDSVLCCIRSLILDGGMEMPRIYPEGGFANIGDKRLEVEWWVFTRDALRRYSDPDFEFNYDSDQIAHVEYFPVGDIDKARERAQQICNEWDERHMPFAVVTLQEQVCEWFVRKDNTASWENAGDAEYFDTPVEAVTQ